MANFTASSQSPFTWLFIFASLSAAISSLLAWHANLLSTSLKSPQKAGLERKSTFFSLASVSIPADQEPFPPLRNFAHVFVHLSPNDPVRTTWEDDKGHPSPKGSVYPDDRHFVVSSTVSTVVQFRHLDFGMENCVLTFRTPPSHASEPRIADIWTLSSTREIARHDLWGLAPPRIFFFATVDLSRNSSIPFHCPSNEFTTFEFAFNPAAAQCNIDFWQSNTKSMDEGISVYQYDSRLPRSEILPE